MATERLILEVRTAGTRTVNRDISRIRKEASNANKTLALLRSTLVVVAGARVIAGFLELSDTLTNVRNRLRLVTTSTDQLNAVQTKLFQISQETRSSFEDNAILFNRLARSTQGLGLSFNELLDITRGINQAIAIAGATSQEARNSLIQFSQGLAAGALRGDELRSVVEQLPSLADAIAKEFSKAGLTTAKSLGITEEALAAGVKEAGELAGGALIAFAKANDGILKTPKIIRAVQNALGNFGQQFSKIDITVGQAFTKFRNNLTLFIGGLSNSIKLGKQMDTVLTVISRNLGEITFALVALLAIGAFNLLTSQLLRFGDAVRGILAFLTTGFTSLGKVLVAPFVFATKGALLFGRATLASAAFASTAYKRIAVEIGLVGTRLGLLRIAITTGLGRAWAVFAAVGTAALARVRAAVAVTAATVGLIPRAVRGAAASFLILTSVVGGLRAVALGTFSVFAGGFKGLIAGAARLIPIFLAAGSAILGALLPALAIIAALVGAFFLVRFAVKKLEERFGSLTRIFQQAIGGIFGLIDGLIGAFGMLPGAIADIGIQAANELISGVQSGINGVIDLLNKIPGVQIDPADLGQITNQFEGEAAKVRAILSKAISDGVKNGAENTKTFKELESLFNKLKGFFSGGLLPQDFDEARMKALLDQINGGNKKFRQFSSGADKARTSLNELLARIDPLAKLEQEFAKAEDTVNKAIEENIIKSSQKASIMKKVAADILNVRSAEADLAQQIKFVDAAEQKRLITTEQAIIARKQLALAARAEFASTLGGVFPLIAAERQLAEIELFILKNRELLSKSGITEDEVKKRLLRSNLGLSETYDQVSEKIKALRDNQKLLGLSNAELEASVRKLNIAYLENQRTAAAGANRAILKLIDEVTDQAKFMEKTFQDVFKSIEDAVVEFTRTGTFSINDFFRNFAEQLIRLGTQQALAGFGGFFTNLLGGKGGFGIGGPSGGGAGIGGLVTGLLGLQNGGSFTVGANSAVQSLPGIDNRLIAFRARDGEDVTVTPRGRGDAAMAPVNQVFNIQTRDADSFKRSQTQIQNRALAGLNTARRRR